MLRRLLCVDDEAKILQGLKRALGFDYEVFIADSGSDGLEVLKREGPFAVVISDMRMPVMDGAAFLKHVKERSPDSTRVLLTGYSDIKAAIRAVNEGEIFRFLTKPCPPDLLQSAITASVEQYRLLNAERELLENTLTGSIKAMSEILEIVSPAAYGRTARLRKYVRHMANYMRLDDRWQYEIAANLSQIGCVGLPSEVIDREYAGQKLSKDEQAEFLNHPQLAQRLIEKIPRLEVIAKMVGHQLTTGKHVGLPDSDPAAMGAKMIRAALTFDIMIVRGHSLDVAIKELTKDKIKFPSVLLEALRNLPNDEDSFIIRKLKPDDLQVDMILMEDVRDMTGTLFAASGHQITALSLSHIRALARDGRLAGPYRVQVRH